MVKKRVVILSKERGSTFGRLALPDGSSALVLDRDAHEKGLKAADKKFSTILKAIKLGAKRYGAGKAA